MAVRNLPLVIAIDGPSGVGKSTAARLLAARLDLPLMDTGAMYRALALDVLEQGADPDDRKAVTALTARSKVDLRLSSEGRFEVLLDSRPVEGLIRTSRVSEASSWISAYPEVRRKMVELQRLFGRRDGAVVEGRDIGSVVFPDAPFKFFIDASAEVRAQRRYRELRERQVEVSLEQVRAEQESRDLRDRDRDASPLIRDESYTHIDTSELSAEATVRRMLATIRA